MTRILEALRRIEAQKTDETVEAALERVETVTALAAACWGDGAPAGPGADAGPSSATIVQPVLPDHRPEACAMPPAEAEIEWQTPDAEANRVARSGDRATTTGDRATTTGDRATTARERATTGEGPPDERTRAYDRLAEHILSRVPAGGGAVLMFTSPLDGQGTAQLLSGLAPLLARRSGGEPLLLLLRAMEGPNPAGRLDELRRHGRLVLVDAGPLERPEVALLSRHCDGSYLVLRPEQTPARALREAVRAIRACEGRFLGTVVVQS